MSEAPSGNVNLIAYFHQHRRAVGRGYRFASEKFALFPAEQVDHRLAERIADQEIAFCVAEPVMAVTDVR